MKIRISTLKRIIREVALTEVDELADLSDEEIMGRIRAHTARERLPARRDQPETDTQNLTPEEVEERFPGATESLPDAPERCRFWIDELNMLRAVCRGRGPRGDMIYGKDETWHKTYTTAKPEKVDRRISQRWPGYDPPSWGSPKINSPR